MTHEPYYQEISPIKSGISGKCPRCGRGKLFSGFLTVADSCKTCNLQFDFADAGDGAAWFVMLITGFAAVGAALWVEVSWQPAYWVHALVAVPFAIILPLCLLRPTKGVLICQQYMTKAAPGSKTEQ